MLWKTFGAKDNLLRAVVRSWRPHTRLLLCFAGILADFRWINILYKTPLRYLDDISPMILDTIFDINIRFGGFIMLVFFLIWQKGWVSGFVLARPEDRGVSRSGTVIRSLLAYLAMVAAVAFLFQAVLPHYGRLILWDRLWSFFFACFFAPLSEEIQYRFALFYALDSFIGRIAAMILTVFLFTLGHNYPPVGLAYIALVGLTASLLTMRWGTLWPAILFHTLVNISANFQISLIYHNYFPQ